MKRYILLCITVSAAAPAGPAAGEFLTAGPAADAFGAAANPDSNYGTAGALSVAARGLAKGEFQTVMRFEMQPARESLDAALGAGQWVVAAVGLQLTAAYPNNPLFNASAAGRVNVAWMQDDSWAEGTGNPSSPGTAGVTYAALPGILAAGLQGMGALAFGGATSGASVYALGLCDGLRADMAAGEAVSLWLSPGDGGVSFLFNSRNFGTAANRPVLMVTAWLGGDANEDGVVDLQDFGALKEHFGQEDAAWGHGDFTGDGAVDLQDFGLLKDHFGQAAPAPAPATAPEPSALVTLACGAAVAARRRRGAA